MRVPHTYPVRKLIKNLKKNGINWVPQKGKGGHGVFEGPDVNGIVQKYPLPSAEHKKEVTGEYLRGMLRRFGLTEKVLE